MFQCENLNDAEHMTGVIINHVNDLIQLSHEPPVQDFIRYLKLSLCSKGIFETAKRAWNLEKIDEKVALSTKWIIYNCEFSSCDVLLSFKKKNALCKSI